MGGRWRIWRRSWRRTARQLSELGTMLASALCIDMRVRYVCYLILQGRAGEMSALTSYALLSSQRSAHLQTFHMFKQCAFS